MRKITWLHLSDIHFHPRLAWRDAHSHGELLAYLRQLFASDPGLRPDLIFCTGDIAFGELPNAPLIDQYADATDFFSKLLVVCGRAGVPLAKERLFVVPGNHDINRGNIDLDAQATLYKKTEASEQHVATINQRFADQSFEHKNAIRRLDEYQAFVKGFLSHQHDEAGRAHYARVLDLDGVAVGICGLNSAWSCAGDEDDRKLWLAAEWQLNHAKDQLNAADLRIALMHHPIDNLNQSERQFVTSRLARDYHFFLHGHSHTAWVNAGTPITVVAGAVGAQNKDEFGVNLVQLDLDSGRAEVHLHRYDKTGWMIAPVPTHAPKGVWQVQSHALAQTPVRAQPTGAPANADVHASEGTTTHASVCEAVPQPAIIHDAGPINLGNPWYIQRQADSQALRHFENRGVTVALKGATGTGKSSMATRLQAAMPAHWQIANIDVGDDFAAADFASGHAFLLQLARKIVANGLASPHGQGSNIGLAALAVFDFDSTPGAFKAFLQSLLPAASAPLFLTLDHLDAISGKPCCSEVLSALRGVHNAQKLLAENHRVRLLLIHTVKPQQVGSLGSVYDVAYMVDVADFTFAELQTLVARHTLPALDVASLHAFLGGHPFLSRMALNAMQSDGTSLPDLIAAARQNGGIFQHHLQRLCQHFRATPGSVQLAQVFTALVKGTPLPNEAMFEALLGLGLVRGSYCGDAAVRCGLYADCLPKRLASI